MPSNYNNALRLEIIDNGEQAGNWGTTTNTNLGTLLVQAITGVESIPMIGSTTLTIGNGVADQARNAVLVLTGTLASAADLIIPAVEKVYFVKNSTSGGQIVTVKTSSGTGVAIANGYTQCVYCDGTDTYVATQAINPAVPPGTVSSVGVDAGSTGLLFSGSSSQTIVNSGTFTFGGTLAVGNGGTGRSSLPSSSNFLISNGTSYSPGSVTSGNAIDVQYTGGNLQVNNLGVTSLTAASGSGITVNQSTGNIIISGSGGGTGGVPSFSGGTTGLTPNTATSSAITLGGILVVANGGTGAQTLTGYVKGTGTNSLTGVSTIPVSDLSGAIGVANGGTGTSTAFTSGSVVFAGASGVYSQNNSNLYWDNTNNRIGIGTASPSYTLHVAGQTFTSGTTLVGDGNYYRTLSGGVAILNFDSNDYFAYTRSTNALNLYISGTNQFSVDSSGNLAFNSGFGSAFNAYGCRAWVNFNGSGGASVRAGGNVSSITYNGTGDYTVNFTNGMPDANYSVALSTNESGAAPIFLDLKAGVAPTTTSVRLGARYGTSWSAQDVSYGMVAIFR